MRLARLLTITTLLLGGVAATTVAAPQALAGPQCYGESRFVAAGTLPPVVRHLPTTTNGSGNTYCGMVEGVRGGGVKALQRTLNVCYGQGLAEDGVYGPVTRWAVANVQAFHKQTVDGWYDPQLRHAMLWAGYRDGAFVNCRGI
ncbi:MAG TPA: peptidoglycan-binding domain-containing protein [Pseudonocardiaceae bacterium]